MMKKQERGITLVALVVTIIVLLILAGIAISLNLENNGIFSRAGNAANIWKKAEANETNEIKNFEDEYDKVLKEMNRVTLASKAKPGDYVKYLLPESEFSFTKDQTGYEALQIYNTQDYKGTWQVLYNDEEHGLRLISTDDVTNGAKLYITGEQGYLNAVDIFNTFCSKYVNTIFATNGRCLGGDTNVYDVDEEIQALKNAKNQGSEGLLNRKRMLDKCL